MWNLGISAIVESGSGFAEFGLGEYYEVYGQVLVLLDGNIYEILKIRLSKMLLLLTSERLHLKISRSGSFGHRIA